MFYGRKDKLFPLGSETKLIEQLNQIIIIEFPNVLKINNNLDKKQHIDNIFKLRDIFSQVDNLNKLKIK